MTPVKVIPKEELWAWKPEIRHFFIRISTKTWTGCKIVKLIHGSYFFAHK